MYWKSLFNWLLRGDVPLDESGCVQGVADVLRLQPAVLGPDRGDNRRAPRLRHDGRLGWDASGRGRPRRRRDSPGQARGRSEAPFYFVDGVEAAMAKAQELAGDRMVEVAAGDVVARCLPRTD